MNGWVQRTNPAAERCDLLAYEVGVLDDDWWVHALAESFARTTTRWYGGSLCFIIA